jgi:hypothetical protein
MGAPSSVTITHPFHPLCGHKLELAHVPRKANTKLLVRHPEGKYFRIPRDWTDFETPQEEHTEALDAHFLDIKGLRAVAKIIRDIGAESLVTDEGEGNDA